MVPRHRQQMTGTPGVSPCIPCIPAVSRSAAPCNRSDFGLHRAGHGPEARDPRKIVALPSHTGWLDSSIITHNAHESRLRIRRCSPHGRAVLPISGSWPSDLRGACSATCSLHFSLASTRCPWPLVGPLGVVTAVVWHLISRRWPGSALVPSRIHLRSQFQTCHLSISLPGTSVHISSLLSCQVTNTRDRPPSSRLGNTPHGDFPKHKPRLSMNISPIPGVSI